MLKSKIFFLNEENEWKKISNMELHHLANAKFFGFSHSILLPHSANFKETRKKDSLNLKILNSNLEDTFLYPRKIKN